jgi:adenylate kinase family enzyme
LQIQPIRGKHSYIVFGPNGGGKGTVADAIKAAQGHEPIKSGDMLRTDPRFKEIIARGSLEASREITELVKKKFFADGPEKNFTWDGYPRDLEQCEILLELLQEAGHEYAVIQIQINLKKAEKLALEGEGRGNRGDEGAIKERHDIYKQNIGPVVGFWRNKAGARYYVVGNNGTKEELIHRVQLVMAEEAKQISKGVFVTVGENFSEAVA